MSKLILLRHGQSKWNELNLFTGWVDVPLSQKGIEEALYAGKLISDIPIDIIFTSTLIRAQMTAMLAMSLHSSGKVPVILHRDKSKLEEWAKIYDENTKQQTIPVICSWELNERMYGELQGLNKAEMTKKFGADQIKKWRRSYDIAPPGGESLAMNAERTLPYFDKNIVPVLAEGKNVFISAHGNSLRAIMMELDRLSHEQVIQLEISTGEPILYDYIDGRLIKAPFLK